MIDTFAPYYCYPTGTAKNSLCAEGMASKYSTKFFNKDASNVVCDIFECGLCAMPSPEVTVSCACETYENVDTGPENIDIAEVNDV